MRILWFCFGWLCVAIGMVGIVLPLLPTTPFLLVAAWAFTRSSERARRWLLEHPRFGPAVTAWREERAIPRKAKIIAIFSLLASLAIALGAGLPPWALAIQVTALTVVSAFILSRPDAVTDRAPCRIARD